MGALEAVCRQQWRSGAFRPRQRYDAWQAALNDSHLPWSLDRPRGPEFSASLDTVSLADLRVVRCACTPCGGMRGGREIAQTAEAFYGLLLIYQGHEEVECRGNREVLGPGSFLLWDSTMPVRFRLHSSLVKTTLFLPQDRLRAVLPGVEQLVGKAIDWRRGLGAVTASHIAALVAEANHLDQHQVGPAAENTLELIAACLAARHELGRDAGRNELLGRIQRYIEANLEDPELSPPQLAAHFNISVRYLHLVFEGCGQSVGRWVLDRRLERCRRDLLRAGARRNVTEIAFQWGFNDAAHFSRVFKGKFGLSPRDYRRRHLH